MKTGERIVDYLLIVNDREIIYFGAWFKMIPCLGGETSRSNLPVAVCTTHYILVESYAQRTGVRTGQAMTHESYLWWSIASS